MDIWSGYVTGFLEQHAIPWVQGQGRQGVYAAMQDVAVPYGGFLHYDSLYSDQSRRRQQQPTLGGKERWVYNKELQRFVDATDYPQRPAALLMANLERLYCFLRLQEGFKAKTQAPAKPKVRYAHLKHDEIKDRLALLCSYCGWQAFNEVPIASPDTRTRTRRPDLCWFTHTGQLWLVDVKTSLSSEVITEMAERRYARLAQDHYGKAPERMLLVLPDYSTVELEGEALTQGYQVMPYDLVLRLMLERIASLHRNYPKVYEGIAAQFNADLEIPTIAGRVRSVLPQL